MSVVISHHRIITDECRTNRTDAGALDEALATTRQAIQKLYGYWPAGKDAKVHIKVEIEYPDEVVPIEPAITTKPDMQTTAKPEWRMKVANHPNRSKANGKERAVVVTTQHRGVFFGYTDDIDGAIIKLRAARNCIYWSCLSG